MLYPTTSWEVLASHERPTVCAAASVGKNRKLRRISAEAVALDCGVRELTGSPLLLRALHTAGDLRASAPAILTAKASGSNQCKVQLSHYWGAHRFPIGHGSALGRGR